MSNDRIAAGVSRHEGIAIIAGTGFSQLPGVDARRREIVRTPYGEPSDALLFARVGEREVVFLPRHGAGGAIAPHRINYRANLWALKKIGIRRIIALAAVGAIDARLAPGDLVLPHQLIDYTWGRDHTFYDGAAARLVEGDDAIDGEIHGAIEALSGVRHIDFSQPYSEAARQQIIAAGQKSGLALSAAGVYAATQGPRLESAAEIDRLQRDGASIVGMTGMPEAALAKELNLEYATLALVVNPAAGRSAQEISMAMIEQHLVAGARKNMAIIENL